MKVMNIGYSKNKFNKNVLSCSAMMVLRNAFVFDSGCQYGVERPLKECLHFSTKDFTFIVACPGTANSIKYFNSNGEDYTQV